MHASNPSPEPILFISPTPDRAVAVATENLLADADAPVIHAEEVEEPERWDGLS